MCWDSPDWILQPGPNSSPSITMTHGPALCQRGTLTFKTQTLAALRAVAGDKCEVKDARSRDEPASQINHVVAVSMLVIKYVSCVHKGNGPWPVVVAVVAGESPSNPETDRLPNLWIFSRKNVQFGQLW